MRVFAMMAKEYAKMNFMSNDNNNKYRIFESKHGNNL